MSVEVYSSGALVSSGTVITDATILSGGNMLISNGGVASNTTVDYCGEMSVLSGGYAESTTISGYDQFYECGSMNIHSGGSASDINITSGGYLRIYSGGNAVQIRADEGSYLTMDIASDTYITGTYAGQYFKMTAAYLYNFTGSGHFFVYDEACVDNFYLSSGSYIEIYSGGSANNIRTRGHITCSGGVINSCFVEKYGDIDIYQGGVAENITLEGQGAGLEVSGEGTCGKNTLVCESACLSVVNGACGDNSTIYGHYQLINKGIATNTFVYNRGNMTVDGSIANNTEVYSGGSMAVSNSATANSTTIYNGGYMTVLGGGVANDTIVNSLGRMLISNGGVINNTTLKYDGDIFISSGGSANNTTVKAGGNLFISSGGTSTDLLLEAGGYLGGIAFYEDKYFSQINNGSAIISPGVVIIGSNMYVSNGGIANKIIVGSDGYLTVSSGGTVNNVSIDFSWIRIEEGGVANDTDLGSWASMAVSGGTANNTFVSKGTTLSIYENGLASNTTVSGGDYFSSACIKVSSGGVAKDTVIVDEGAGHIFSGGIANNVIVNSLGKLYISQGGLANNVIINRGGYIYVSSGASASIAFNPWMGNIVTYDTEVTYLERDAGIYLGNTSSGFVEKFDSANNLIINNEVSLIIYSGGIAESSVINSGGSIHISSGGIANNTVVNSSGYMFVSQGGTVNSSLIMSEGYIGVLSAGLANNTNIGTNGFLRVSCGGSAVNTSNSGGDMSISGTAINTILDTNGWLGVDSGGNVSETTVNSAGRISIFSAGKAYNTLVNSGGSMYIASGGVHYGSLHIEEGAVFSISTGAQIDFTVANRTIEDDYLINDISLISGTPTYTITVTADQVVGIYKLAQRAENFTGTISIGDGENTYGTVTVNGTSLIFNDAEYTLTQTDGNLTLSINNTNIPKNLFGSSDGVRWDAVENAQGYQVEFSYDGFRTGLTVETVTTAVDTYNIQQKDYVWHVKTSGGDWSENLPISGTGNFGRPQLIYSDNDGDIDVFFAAASGIWGTGYGASHQGIAGIWNGLYELATLRGKNKFEDVFIGSSDANILVLTDDTNGDAFFVEDVFSSMPNSLAAQARIAAIDEIRAGAGDDVIDLTSQRFVYVGDGLTVYGGSGNDTIWANSGKNCLFGDAGNDRIVGGSGDDIIVGGIGNDSMHGGGGSDTFCFGENWGADTIEQLADGSVTLWFESGSESNWNASTLTYSDGTNSVTVSGIDNANIILKFGDTANAIAGAFDSFASEKIFEDQEKALLA